MFDVKLISRLVDLMVEKDLREIDLKDGESRIVLKRGAQGEPVYAQVASPPVSSVAPTGMASASKSALPGEADPDAGLVALKSPMVGTYYAASDPESPPFVNVGSAVGPDSPVCIIEAMKVFNEIKAETSGTIERILVQNEQAVEFGQPLFLVRPS